MSVRDGRVAPFIWASVAALAHLRANWSQEAEVRPHVGRSVYYALCELANEERKREHVHEDSGKFRTSRKRICEQAGVSDKPVDKALRELERIGLLSVERAEANGSRPGSASAYTIHEPPAEPTEKVRTSGDEQRAEKVRTSSGGSPDVGAEEVRTTPHIGKKGKKEEPPVCPRQQKVAGKAVSAEEYALATAIIAAFNEAAGTRFTADAHLTRIVLRIREKPELSAEDHRGIVAAVFAVPWWSGSPGPQVIYGNAEQFERSIETWRVAPREHLHAVEPPPDLAEFEPGRAAFQAAWPEISQALRRSVPESTYRLWIEPLRPLGAKGDTVLIGAAEGVRAWAERRYRHLIEEALAETGWRHVRFLAVEDEDEPTEAAA